MSAEGRLINDRYRLQQRIGSGAMGVVWRAVDERLHRTVAVKQLLLQQGYTEEETEEARQRSMREGRIAARLQHQNAIAVFDVAEDEGQPVLVMEYLPSKSLATVLAERGTLPPLEVARIGTQVAAALSAAHMAGIVHRDLKPGNILLGNDGTAKITDFGISRAIGDVSITKSGILAGTPAYLAPEVALGRDPAPASDVFSLGSTLYAAIEGEPPFGLDENAISLLHHVARGDFEPPRQAGPMEPALLRLLRPDPVDRPTMAQGRDLLQSVVDGRPVAYPGGSAQRGGPAPAWPQAPVGGPGRTRAESRPAASGTRVAAPMASNPPTRVGGAAAAGGGVVAAGSRERRSRRNTVFAVIAVLVAALIGILVANAMYRDDQSRAAALTKPSQQPAPVPAGTTQANAAPPAEAPTSSESSSSATSVPSTTRGQPRSERVSAQEMEQTVERYYSLVPHNLDAAWDMLGPGLQSQGKDSYEGFWHSIDNVKILGTPRATGSNVMVALQFDKDGSTSREWHLLGLVASPDGKILINTDNRI